MVDTKEDPDPRPQQSADPAGFAMAGGAMVLVGSIVLVGKTVATLDLASVTAIRLGIAGVILVPWALARFGVPRFSLLMWARLAVQAALGSVFYTVLLFGGLRLTGAVEAGIIGGLLPVLSGLFGVIALGERPGRALIAAIALGTASLILLNARNLGTDDPATLARLAGNALVLLAVLSECGFILLQKTLASEPPALQMSALMSGLGFVLIAPVAVAVQAVAPSAVTATDLAALAYYAIGPTVGGYVLWYAGASRLSAGHCAVATLMMPLAAVVLSILVLGERPDWVQGLALAGILCAIPLGALARSPARAAAAQPPS